MAMGPLDYDSGVELGRMLFPDYAAREIQKRNLAVSEGTLALNQFKQARDIAEEQSFGADLAKLPANFTLDQWQQFAARHPSHIAAANDFYKTADTARRDSDLQRVGMIWNAANGGNYTLAASLVKQHIDADVAAGREPDPMDKQIFADLASGDATRQANATRMAKASLMLIDPGKLAGAVGELEKGAKPTIEHAGADLVIVDPATNKATRIYRGPISPGPGGLLLPDDETAGDTAPAPEPAPAPAATGPAPSAGAPKPGQYAPAGQEGGDAGFAAAVEHIHGHEGDKYVASDMNGRPVKFGINQGANPDVDVRNLTWDQAKDIYKKRYWDPSGAANLPANMQAPYFDVYIRNPGFAKAALARAQGDPNKFMDQADAFFGKLGKTAAGQPYAQSWANRDQNNRAVATGEQPAGVAPAPPPIRPVAAGVIQTGDGTYRTKGGGDTGLPPAPQGYHWGLPPKAATGADVPDLSPQAIDDLAGQRIAGAPWNQLLTGYGKQAAKAKIMIQNRATEKAHAEGLSPEEQNLQMAWYHAKTQSVAKQQMTVDMVNGNEKAFVRAAQLAKAAARAVSPDTNYRLFNIPINEAKRQTGDPKIAAMDVAIRTAAAEYGRLATASPSGAGTLSDSARNEYLAIINGNFPLRQKMAALDQMMLDGHSRVQGLRDGLAESLDELRNGRAPGLPPRKGQGGGSSGGAVAGATKSATGPKGEKIYLVNGRWVDPSGKPIGR